jgi:hypothetical protein
MSKVRTKLFRKKKVYVYQNTITLYLQSWNISLAEVLDPQHWMLAREQLVNHKLPFLYIGCTFGNPRGLLRRQSYLPD